MLGYGAANACLRRLADLKCDPLWAIFNKELVSVLIVGPWLAVRAWRGLPSLPTGRPLLILILVGLATELLGNTGMQWAYGVAGLAVMVPANMGFLLVASALLGWLLLRERVAPRSLGAIAVLIVSLAMLTQGAEGFSRSIAGPGPPAAALLVPAAIGVACGAGVIYALLTIAIRHCVTGTIRLSAVVVLITGMGVLCLGPLSLLRLGLPALLHTPGEQFFWMFTAGLCNLVAFFALIRGLQLMTVLHVNLVNAGQVALAVLSGIWLFHENPGPWLIAGVSLTIAGVFLIGRTPDHEPLDPHL